MKHVKVFIILDKSGSMESCRNETITGFNEQLETIRENAKLVKSTTVSLIIFNQDVDFYCFDAPINKVKKLTTKTYNPSGYTAMYDAVGACLDRAIKEIPDREDNAYLVIIISDGEENSSRNYTAKNVADKVQELQDSGKWTFTYLGANQDLTKIQQELKIPLGNMAMYAANSIGTQYANTIRNSAISGYFGCCAKDVSAMNTFYGGVGKIRNLTKEDITNE